MRRAAGPTGLARFGKCVQGFAREFDYLVRAIQIGAGSDDVIIRQRHLLDTHLLHAMELCQAFQAVDGSQHPHGAWARCLAVA
jgi:hypothetical protein